MRSPPRQVNLRGTDSGLPPRPLAPPDSGMRPRSSPLRALALALLAAAPCAAEGRRDVTARASGIDPHAREHPEIDFVFGTPDRPRDLQHASVDPRVPSLGRLVIWLMPHNPPLFERLAGYGCHAIQPHYANGWFAKLHPGAPPADELFLSKIRLEAATGQDFSDAVAIPEPDGLMGRSLRFVQWLHREHPRDGWGRFLAPDGRALRWDRVTLAGISHGATTAARLAKHVEVERVVMFSGPRDQFERWQSLPSATPPQRFFGFTHVLDDGWTRDHYCRSWQMLGLAEFGPVTDVDRAAPPFGDTRRLVTAADVKGDPKRAHNAVVPGGSAPRDAGGKFLHEAVWKHLFTHPVERVGEAVPPDPSCRMRQRPAP